jgi:hypothetical protein
VRTVPGQPAGADEAFAGLDEAMGRFLSRYDSAQLAIIVDFCLNTIEHRSLSRRQRRPHRALAAQAAGLLLMALSLGVRDLPG